MLISYALFIFALASSVVAPPPPPHQHAPSRSEQGWKVLEGNDDKRLIGKSIRWHRVKHIGAIAGSDLPSWSDDKKLEMSHLPSWPQDEILDQALEFIATDDAGGGVGRVSSFTFYRKLHEQNKDLFEFYFYGYSKNKMLAPLDHAGISLEGFWGLAYRHEAYEPTKLDPNEPVKVVRDIIQIQKHSEQWEFRFIGNLETLNHYTFSPALMMYKLDRDEALPLMSYLEVIKTTG
ncbi:hypothetical protein AX14_003678 [Amanita brunnescens Koide BX004]|nr:hypothetical protein AX14_003678 [Amanita brunnescens Koide BX004]